MKYDVSGIGSPLLDLTLNVDDEFLIDLGFKKGSMHRVDESEDKILMDKISSYETVLSPGGSASNVLADISFIGGRTVLLGKIGQDTYGDVYRKETEKVGTDNRFVIDKLKKTGHAITFITPDSERTFAVHLGAALDFGEKDIDIDSIVNSQILHLEAFMMEGNKTALEYAVNVAKKSQTKISVDLSDGELIKRNIDYLKKFVHDHVDIVFANDTEAKSFTGFDAEKSLHELSKYCDISVVKLGGKGSMIKKDNKVYDIKPFKVTPNNTNGAGDMYAAGILYGISHNIGLEKSGVLASRLASLVVAEEGARLKNNLEYYNLNLDK